MQIGHGKNGVLIGEYGFYRPEAPDTHLNPGTISDGCSNDKNRVIGWVEPVYGKPSWIIWFTEQGDAVIYRRRETEGGVVGEPIRLKANGDHPEDELRQSVHEFFNAATPSAESKLRRLMYGEAKPLSPNAVWYGPFACDKCAVLICRIGREFGSECCTYPEGPIYPNTEWAPHVCQQRDVERVNGLRSIGFGMMRAEPPSGA